ncbi:reverse transcriptase [Corchorus capsularis]|uniref:Reverse transcriptase n=1 Tax=Corchorus capsularis TaxID=210143 RepID=A0A1R3FZP4_COCAP|nr:reverse transcriptase [Corchorus capsularis]
MNYQKNLFAYIKSSFNQVLTVDDKFGGRPEPLRCMEQFRVVVDRCRLIDLDVSGCTFTWTNKQEPVLLIKEKLDRALYNVHWRHYFSDVLVRNLPRAHSDHCPVLVSLHGLTSSNPSVRPFQFEAAWQSHATFSSVLSSSWDTAKTSNHSLSHLRGVLGDWNRDIFGNIYKKKWQFMARLGGVQCALETRPNLFLYRLEKELTAKYNLVLSQEEMIWFQKSQSNWVQFGDRNTKFFHTTTLICRNRNKISALKGDNGDWIVDSEIIKQLVLSHFQLVYQAERIDVDFENCCLKIRMPLNDEQLMLLSHVPQEDEIHSALKAMTPYKSSGPDGFQAAFYQANWEVVRELVYNFVKNAFITGQFEEDLSRVLIVLIPKVESPVKVTQFRPISLCNVMVKLLSKFLVNRLRPMLKDLISPTQSSFIPGRGTTNNIIVKVNFAKSLVYTSPNVPPQLMSSIVAQTGIFFCDGLGRYLGVPLHHSRVSHHTYDHLIDRVKKRLASWKANSLSLVGRATLVYIHSAMNIVLQGIARLIGDGFTTSFWRDKWLGGGVLFWQIYVMLRFRFQMQTELVSDYVSSLGWIWDKLQLLPINIHEELSLVLPTHGEMDRNYWLDSSDGLFSVSSTYKLLTSEPIDDFGWKKLWKIDVMPRVKHFLWLVRHDRLLTRVACFRRHITPVATCPRCGATEEPVLHVLRDCGTSQSIRSRWLHGAKLVRFNSLNLNDWLRYNFALSRFWVESQSFREKFLMIAWGHASQFAEIDKEDVKTKSGVRSSREKDQSDLWGLHQSHTGEFKSLDPQEQDFLK